MPFVSNKKPLQPAEREILTRSFRELDTMDCRTAEFFWSTGCHPWSLANPDKARWRFTEEAGIRYVHYIRAKQHGQTDTVLNPAIVGWAETFLETEAGHSEFEYLRRVRRHGRAIGLQGLTCRALRHDRIYLCGKATGWNMGAMVEMWGTDAHTLVGYMNADEGKSLSKAIIEGAF